MADLGFTELSMEPVVCAPEDPAALTAEDLEIVKDQYELLAKDMPVSYTHLILLYFRTGISPHKTPSKPVSTPLEGAMI